MSAIRDDIEKLAAQTDACHEMIAGLNDEEITARPGPGVWSIAELVMHLMDCDAMFFDRMRLILTRDDAFLPSFEEDDFTRIMGYNDRDARLAADAFRANRLWMADVLRAQPDSAFLRHGAREGGPDVTVARLVTMLVAHVDHHATFARGKRDRLGKPM